MDVHLHAVSAELSRQASETDAFFFECQGGSRMYSYPSIHFASQKMQVGPSGGAGMTHPSMKKKVPPKGSQVGVSKMKLPFSSSSFVVVIKMVSSGR